MVDLESVSGGETVTELHSDLDWVQRFEVKTVQPRRGSTCEDGRARELPRKALDHSELVCRGAFQRIQLPAEPLVRLSAKRARRETERACLIE